MDWTISTPCSPACHRAVTWQGHGWRRMEATTSNAAAQLAGPCWRPAGGLALPADLRLWLGEDRLLRLTLASAAHRADAVALPRTVRQGDQVFPATQLLALLAFAYLTGRLSSVEIEEALEADSALRYLCAGRFPASPVLRRFRRSYRRTLVLVLSDVLTLAVRERASHGWLTRPGLGAFEPPASGSVGDGAAEVGCREAELRVGRAVLADTMALDY